MDPPTKKHSKPGRRLFSFGAVESSDHSKRPPTSDSASTTSRYTDYTTSPQGGSTLQLLTEEEEQYLALRNIGNNSRFGEMGEEKPRSGSPFGGSLRTVTQAQVAGSRKLSTDSSSSLPFYKPDPRRRPSAAEVSSVRSGSPDSLRSQSSRARWDFLRQRVLVAGADSLASTGTVGHGQAQQQEQRQRQPSASSSTSSYSVPTPARSPTPKLSRFARLGFWQVVDSAREAAAAGGVGGHESRKFAEDIKRACWSSRFPSDPSKSYKYAEQRDLTAGSSALYLPFMSGSALLPPSITTADASAGMNASTVSLATPHGRKHELRRPQSIQNFASSPSRPTPSVNQLLQTLLRHAPVADQPLSQQSYLPHENQVHAALLAPFLTLDSGDIVDEERRMSVEAFEVVVKSWKAETQEVGIDRCLWCCKAASRLSTYRMRILGILWSLVLPLDPLFEANTPATLQTLMQAFFLLLKSLSTPNGQSQEIATVRQLISQIQVGAGGELNKALTGEEYGATFSRKDLDQTVREALISECLCRCLEYGVDSSRRWILRNILKEYWPVPPQPLSLTPLLTAIYTRKLNAFGHAAVSILLSKPSDPSTRRLDAEVIVSVLQTRVIPEIDAIRERGATGTMDHAARIILELFCINDSPDILRWVTSLACYWYQEVQAWRLSFETTMQRLIANSDWPTILRNMSSLVKVLPDEVRKTVVAYTLPLLYDQLTTDPPAYPCLPLTNLLETISRSYPQLFYKPLFSCAASSKEPAVVNHLCTISAISRFLPDFWTRDAEMMAVALLSDAGGKGKSAAEAGPKWGNARLGQSVLLIELAGRIQSLRQLRNSSMNPESIHASAVKFATELESRLGILLDAKEAKVWVPISQRLVFCILFLQVRLLTRSLKTALWLPRVVSWLLQYYSDDDNHNASTFDGQLTESANQLRALYSMAQEGARSRKSRGTLMLSPMRESTFSASTVPNTDMSEMFADKVQLVSSLSKGFAATALELLVVLSGILKADDYRKMGPVLWNNCLDSRDARIVTPGCFLAMQCAEKITTDFLKIIKDGLHSTNTPSNLRTIRRISTISNWRFQILSQHVIVDRTHRGPFKLARDPLPFVATDIGSSVFAREEDPNEQNGSIPLELRKRLLEIGWTDENNTADQRIEWIRTPMSLLPMDQLDHLYAGTEDSLPSPSSPSVSPIPSPTKSPTGEGRDHMFLTRKSSFSAPLHGTKRRAVFVPALAAIFPHLALLVFNSDFTVAAAARTLVIDLMRNDAALLSRPIFDFFADDRKGISFAISAIRAFLHVRRALPPAMAHNVFNNLAGFLKHAAKQVESPDTLHDFAQVIPTMSKLVTQVSGVSIREFRRAKVEVFVIPSGSLWFSSSAPVGPMFPRSSGVLEDPLQIVTARLVSVVTIRLSQNMFFLAMLRRNAQDVQLVRKNMSRLVLPSFEATPGTGPLELKDFVPHRNRSVNDNSQLTGLSSMSLAFARSYLLLIAQIFRSMSRHLNDRNELAVLIDGLNRILLAYGSDIGIVAQAMIALMVASTRFRRLFASGGGFTLFMPALVKTFSESDHHPGVREAIIYTVQRFFAQHNDNFIFQSLDIMSHIMMVPGVDGDWIAQNVFSLFSSLKTGTPAASPDAAGIHDSNKVEERDALIVSTAEEKPQAFLASLRQGGSNGKDAFAISLLPQEYESKRLRLDNFVRLFLTVIAHDTTILRAEQFLRLFRFLAPYLYNSSTSARLVLRDGIDALGLVLMRPTGKTKTPEAPSTRPIGDSELGFQPSESFVENQLHDKSKAPSNLRSMRTDYLCLMVAFIRSGGQMRTTSSKRAIEVVKAVLKDFNHNNCAEINSFFTEYSKTTLLRLDTPNVKDVIAFIDDLLPVISAYATTVDFSGVFDTFSQLVGSPALANEPLFSQRVGQLCAAGLNACEMAALEKHLFALPLRHSLITLMTEAVYLRGADVISEMEKCTPSYDFLAGVVLPFVKALETTTDGVSESLQLDSRRRIVLARVWVRLLSYAMSACQKGASGQKSPRLPERAKSDKHRPSSSVSSMNVLVTALQIVKVIIIRADNDISSSLPGIWSRIGSFFQSLLGDGNARFAMQDQHSAVSPAQYAGLGFTSLPSTDFESPAFHASTSYRKAISHPRMVDYSLWSLFELLCQIRNPLFIQLRLFIREKVTDLDGDLRVQQQTNAAAAAAPNSTPASRRVSSSSIFSKPRRRMSRVPSPESAEKFSDNQHLSPDLVAPPSPPGVGIPPQQPSFPSRSSLSRGGGGWGEFSGQKIVHLGLVQSPTRTNFGKSAAIAGGGGGGGGGGGVGVRGMSKSFTVNSPSLVRATYQRIRLVQSWLGYDSLLLPLPDEEWPDTTVTTWTKRQALEAVIEETDLLMKEFEESARVEEDDGGIVDPDQSTNL